MTRSVTGDQRAQPGLTTTVKDGDLRTAMPVHDFMLQLGAVMRLPSKPRAPTPLVTDVVKAPRRTRWWLPALAVAVALGTGARQLIPAPRAEVPAAVVGTWQTSDPRYAGRQLVLAANTIVETDQHGVLGTPERVTALSLSERGDTMTMAIQHQAEGEVATLNLVYVRSPDEYLTLRNPAGVNWRRVGDSLTAAPKKWTPGPTPPTPAPGKKAWEH